jgi:hypothetical protein
MKHKKKRRLWQAPKKDHTGERVVVAEDLEVVAVAPGAAVGGHQPVEGPVPAAEPREPDPHHHGWPPWCDVDWGGGEGLSRIECFSFGERGRGKRRKTRRTVLGFMGRKFEGKGPRFDGKGRRKNFRRRVAVTGAETGCAWILYGKRSSVPTS